MKIFASAHPVFIIDQISEMRRLAGGQTYMAWQV